MGVPPQTEPPYAKETPLKTDPPPRRPSIGAILGYTTAYYSRLHSNFEYDIFGKLVPLVHERSFCFVLTLADAVRGSVYVVILGPVETRERRASGQGSHTTDSGHWRRRGWLVLLRARHKQFATAGMSSRWRWAGCGRKRERSTDMLLGVAFLHHEEHDVEGGQGGGVQDAAVLEVRQLLIRVVEFEEDGVFRSIVGYL